MFLDDFAGTEMRAKAVVIALIALAVLSSSFIFTRGRGGPSEGQPAAPLVEVLMSPSGSGGDPIYILEVVGDENFQIRSAPGGVRFFIDNSGRVGIGTTSPSRRLTIEDSGENLSFSFDGSNFLIEATDGFKFMNIGAANASTELIIEGNGQGGALLKIKDGQYSGTWGGFEQSGQTFKLDYGSSETVTTLFNINPDGQDVDVRFEGTSDENLLFIDAGNNRVGIGTATPGSKLQVAGNILPTSHQIDNLGSEDLAWDRVFVKRLSIVASHFDIKHVGENITFEAEYGDFRFVSNGTNRMTIENGTGNVGIGTTSPRVKLDVDGAIEYSFEKYIQRVYDFLDYEFGGWQGTTANGGQSIGDKETGWYGVRRVSTGSTASNGRATIRESALGDEWIKAGDGAYVAEFRFGAINNLNDATDQYTIFIGITDINNVPLSTTDGIYFRYDDDNTDFRCVTESSDTITETTSGVIVATGTAYWGKIEINSAGTEVKFYLGTTRANMTLKATHTTNIPTVELSPYFAIEKQAGTSARRYKLDLWYHRFDLTTAR